MKVATVCALFLGIMVVAGYDSFYSYWDEAEKAAEDAYENVVHEDEADDETFDESE